MPNAVRRDARLLHALRGWSKTPVKPGERGTEQGGSCLCGVQCTPSLARARALGYCLALLAPCLGTEGGLGTPGNFPSSGRMMAVQGGLTWAYLDSCYHAGVCGEHCSSHQLPGAPPTPAGPNRPCRESLGLRENSTEEPPGASGGWGEAARPGPSPELGVVDQGAQGSGEGGHVALQPRRAGSGHGLPQGARRKEEQAGGSRPGAGGTAAGGCREAEQPGQAAGRKPASCVVRHGPSLGKPGRQRWGWRPGCRGSSGRERWDSEA